MGKTRKRKYKKRGNFMDSRIIKTRREIRNTFLDLLNEYPYDKISIKLLCEQAYIARPTLYAHYQSIQNVLIDCVDNKLEKANVQNFFENFSENSFIQYFSLIRMNQRLIEVLFQNNVDGVLYHFNKKYLSKEGILDIASFATRPDRDELTARFVTRLSAILYVSVSELVEGGFKGADDEVAHTAFVLACRAIDSVLEGNDFPPIVD